MDMNITVEYNEKTARYEVVQWQETNGGRVGGVLAKFDLLQEAVEYMEQGR